MYVPMPVLAAIAILFLVLLFFAFRRRSGERDLIAPPNMSQHSARPAMRPAEHRPWPAGAAPIGDLADEMRKEVRELVDAGNKIEAIKLVRAATHLGLREAKELVERM